MNRWIYKNYGYVRIDQTESKDGYGIGRETGIDLNIDDGLKYWIWLDMNMIGILMNMNMYWYHVDGNEYGWIWLCTNVYQYG